RIVNLGLEPWEAVEMGLEVEDVEEGEKRKPVADYVLEREDEASDGESWEEWLQTHRVELNAMTTPEFIRWLDSKMVEHGDGKLIPPPAVREGGLEGQVTAALVALKRPKGTTLAKGIGSMCKPSPEREWRAHIEAVVAELDKKV